MTSTYQTLPLTMALLLLSGTPSGSTGDSLEKLRVDFRAAAGTGLSGDDLSVLQARAVGLVQNGPDQITALQTLDIMIDIAKSNPGPEAGRALARVANAFAGRFESNYPVDGISLMIYRFFWRDLRRPAAETAENRRLASEDYQRFLGAFHGEAGPDWMKAVALFNLVENRLLFDRELGGLSDSQREAAVEAAAELRASYGSLPVPTRKETISVLADEQLFELSGLHAGSVAPDIEGPDLGGVRFKLSDYRGKVVLLDFWAGWCRACIGMFPHERELAARHRGDPFALIGVNGDYNLAAARKAAREHHLTWRSFAPGPAGPEGPIPAAWNVRDWPLLYVIDPKGRILYKGRDGEEIDRAIEVAVEAAKARRA